jgi:hypothetical protein
MIRWFFLAFIALTFVAGNGAVFGDHMTADARVFAFCAVNLFGLSIMAIWLGAYYQRFRGAGFLIFGHAMLMLSAGIAFLGMGIHGLLTNSCGFLINYQRSSGTISKLATWATENNACSLLSVLFVLFGFFMLWPSLKLFYGITSQSIKTR